MPFPITDDQRRKQGLGFAECHFKRRFVASEDFFLAILSNTPKKSDVLAAVNGLQGCGSKRSLAILKQLLSYPNQDVKSSSLGAIALIAEDRESIFYGETLNSPAYPCKFYAMDAICRYADVRAADFVLQHFHKNRSKIKHGYLDTLVDGLLYLYRIRHEHAGAQKFLIDLVPNWATLGKGVRIEIAKHIPNFVADVQNA